MLIVAHVQPTEPSLITINPADSDNRNTTIDLQFALKDLILAVCGTAASTFTICMLVTFTRCCCKKQKDDSDAEDPSTKRRSGGGGTSTSLSTRKSLWKRSWRRPLDSAATTGTQESSTSENITQVTIERRESYTDERDSELSDGYDEDDDEGGFTKGCGRLRHGDTGKSRKSHSKDSDDNAAAPSVKDRIRAFEGPVPEVKVREGIKPRKNKPTSKAFSEFESKGILIGFGGPRYRHEEDEADEDEGRDGTCDSPLGVLLPSPTSGHSLEDTPTSSRGLEDDEGVHTMESEEDEFAAIQRNGEVLKSFRRAPPPRNRSRARRSGRGRRQVRGQDVSSSEQIAEEPSSGSFGSRPTSGINSPATTATPEEEEHDSFEASLHMTTESLSVARSSSISQTPQSSLDSMDSPKRQPSVSSRESPLRGSAGDSPKRLLDSPMRQLRSGGDISPRRTPPLGPRSPAHPQTFLMEEPKPGPSDFSLTIPVEFQQQRLGSQPPLSVEKGTQAVAGTSAGGGRPRRPMSYHVDASNRLPHTAGEKFRPMRPLSSHVQSPTESDSPEKRHPLWPSSTDTSPSSVDQTQGQDGLFPRTRDQSHLHGPVTQDVSHLHRPSSRDQSHLHEPRPRDLISQSHGHLGVSREGGMPVGRVLPQVRQPGTPGELRRWESEHSYLQEEAWPGRTRKGGGRGRGQGAEHNQPPGSASASTQGRQTLRPTPEDGQVLEHPQSEKLERKVLTTEPRSDSKQGPEHPSLSGVTEVLTSEKDGYAQTFDVPPPRPPLPSWRKMKPALKLPHPLALPPRGSPTEMYSSGSIRKPKVTLKTRSKSFHFSEPRERQSRYTDYELGEQKPLKASTFDDPDGLNYDITPEDIRKTWDGMIRSRSLERPGKRLQRTFSPEHYPNAYSSLDNYALLRSKSVEVSPGRLSRHQSFSNTYKVPKSKSLEMYPEQINRHYQWRNFDSLEFQGVSYEVDKMNGRNDISRPQATRETWQENTTSSSRQQTEAKSACGDVPWLRAKESEEEQNLRPSDIRKSLREFKKPTSSAQTSKSPPDDIRNWNRPLRDQQNNLSQTHERIVNRSSKTEALVSQQSPDFKRNDPKSQSVRSPKSPPEYRKNDMRYSMREKSSNAWETQSSGRNLNGGKNSQYLPPRKQNPEMHIPTSQYKPVMIMPTRQSKLGVNPSVQNSAEVNVFSSLEYQKSLEESPPPPRPPLPMKTPWYKPNSLPANINPSDVQNGTGRQTEGTFPNRSLGRSQQRQNTDVNGNNQIYNPENPVRWNQQPYPTQSSYNNMPPSVDVRPGVNVQKDTYTQNLAKYQDNKNEIMSTTALSPDEKHWSMEETDRCNEYQSNTPKPELSEQTWKPDVVEDINSKLKSCGEQLPNNGYTAGGIKKVPNDDDDQLQWGWTTPSDDTNRNTVSGTNYVDMTEGIRKGQADDISESPNRPKSPNEQLSPVPVPSIFSEPSPVPSDLPPSDHVLRFTRDPRWKDCLVKPEAKSMYEVMQVQDITQYPGFPYTFTPEDRNVEGVSNLLLRDTPDVVPISERRISPRITVPESDLQFKFNFDTEATEI